MKRPKAAGTSPWRKRSPSSSTAASARPGIPSSAKKPSEADSEKTGILPAFFYRFKWLARARGHNVSAHFARAPVRQFSFFAGDAGLNHDKEVFSHADADPHCDAIRFPPNGADLHGDNKEFPAQCGPAIQVRTCPNIYDCFYFWNTIPASPTFFPAARKECRPRKDRRPVIPP